MPRFCASCGTQVADTATFCAGCGTPAGQTAGAAPAAAPAPAPVPAAAPAAGGMTDNVAGLLAYLFIPAIIFLVMEPYNKKPFVRFHSFQSVFFAVAQVVFWIVYSIISMIVGFVVPFLAHMLFGLLGMLIWLGLVILWVVLLIKAYQGQMWKLPFIGDLAEKQAKTV